MKMWKCVDDAAAADCEAAAAAADDDDDVMMETKMMGIDWCWFVEAVTKLYIASLSYRRIRNQIAVAMAAGDKVALKKLVVLRRMLFLDVIKLGCDLPLSVHYARMYDNGPSTVPDRWVGILGVVGSLAQFLVRFQQQTHSYSLDLCLSNKIA
ncbi:hypothetical protein GUITHDRAFT_108400 [Guillardia theta CCMP2712]|uniref:Uncharacterized protein n=1 Tax=Guillardia theta (strain CCMP2712) TaxID=905079 RepID=L1JAH0_GUITC|nr:hypothetical protein GUITHDRAFT_108400 [Guillardia theta CCMP2712]EKX45526.1 hypothetical protein GUITHDRAFT_108400 [Guillardia theta CCMP2712]|eukprot:XP_005832506.1 hypothetical protein GUITHDRAFT_108400 [Guillardia theta CCMP2712]